MRRAALVIALLAGGCEKALVDDVPDATAPPLHCPAVTPPLAPGAYKLYLDTEGVAITQGACDDARTNCSGVPPVSVTLPPFLDGVADRGAIIGQIVNDVQDALAPYSIDVVSARPASGDYEMEVLGGVFGDPTSFGAAPFVCDASNRDHIGFTFDRGASVPVAQYANGVLSDVGAMLGLGAVTRLGDCMCRAAGCDVLSDRICTFDTMAPTELEHACGRTPTQDEPALLSAALGCR